MKFHPLKPFPSEVEEATRNPNGWVYRIAGHFSASDRIPREAIVGAWKVDAKGKISSEFVKNENYDAKRWPSEVE